MKNHRNSLQPGYTLHWYVIKKILGQGGFGITYLADDTNLQQEVAIKEFLPVDMAVREPDASIHPMSSEYGEHFRWGLDRFMSEAQTLARFKHPNIVRVNAVFPENNTAYMVMEYERGIDMHELLKKNKTLSQDEINTIILPILDGLEQVHASGFIHRDIKPPNIFIRDDSSPVLLDFGSARQSFGLQTRTLTTMVSPGFAPFEQYVSKGDKQGPWTDIYGLGATVYRAVTGRSPANAMDRSEALLHTSRDIFVTASELNPEGYSDSLLAAIDHALAFKPEDRPQTIAEWKREFGVISDQKPTGTVVTPVAYSVDSESETIAVTEEIIPADKMDQVLEEQDDNRSFIQSAGAGLLKYFKKIVKWGTIGFCIILLLSIMDKISKKNGGISETRQEPEKMTVQKAGRIMPENESTIDAITETGRETEDKTQTVERLLTGANEDLDALRLTTPVGDNATEKYRAVLAIEPDNLEASNGLDRVVDEYIHLMNNALHDNNPRWISQSMLDTF